MKYFILLSLSLSAMFGFAFSQTTVKTIVSADNVKSKNPSPTVNSSNDKNVVADQKTSDTKYYEYKVPAGDNTNGQVDNGVVNDLITLPIVAEEYTDPNYELNKQKSIEINQQVQTSVPQKTNEELILDLQTKIKGIKDGTTTDANAIQKLPFYEEELQILLNKK